MTQVFALHDGRAGNARQALALARALSSSPGEYVLHPRAPWCWLAPRALPGSTHAFGNGFDPVHQQRRCAIGCGRQAALATRLIRDTGGQAVQILDPRIDPRHWDVVVAPRHDGLQGDNVIEMVGSLHPVDDLWLAQARRDAAPLAELPGPHTVVLVGAPSKHVSLHDRDFEALLARLARQARREDGSLSVIASRRTPERWRALLTALPNDLPGIRWRDERDGHNPYAGLLGHADRIVCTPDSVNMLSEAAATLAPVFVWSAGLAQGRLRRFLDDLLARGRIREADDTLAPFAVEPLRETTRVADLVRQRLGLAES